MTNIGKSRQYINREKTPIWLTNPEESKDTTDPDFEKDRDAFLKQLEVNWEE